MAFDAHKNFAYSAIAIAPSPASSGTTLSVSAGTGALFPAAPFNCTVWPTTEQPISTNAEIIRVTSKGTGDNWTIVRTQEGSSARAILVGDQIAASITAKIVTDLETSIPSTAGLISAVNISAGATSNNLSALTFNNSNGVTFGLTGSVVTATVATNYQSPGAYLTTAMQSDAVTLSNIKVSAGASSALLSALTFSNSNGLAFGLNAGTVTGSYTVPTVTAGSDTLGMSNIGNTSGTTGVVSGDGVRMLFAGGNNITLSQSINGVSATITISGANVGGAQTGISGIAASNTTYTSGSVTFSGVGGGVTVNSNTGQRVDISVAAPVAQTVQTQNLVAVSLSGNTAGVLALVSSGTVIFAGGNNITLSQNGQSVTISGANAGGAQTGISGIIVSDATYSSGTVSFSNAGNITISSSVNGATQFIRLSGNAAQTNQSAIKGFGVSNTGQTAGNTGLSTGIDWVLAGSNSITLSQSTVGGGPNTVWIQHPAWVTTALTSQSTQYLALTLGGNTAGTTTFNASNNATLFLNGGNNITLSGNGSTVTISAAAQTNQSAIKGLGASNTGNTAGNTGLSTGIDWVIAGSNNITISQSTAGGGPNTLWVSGPTVGGAQTGISGIIVSDASYTSGTVSFSNAGNITISSSVNGATQYIRLSGNAAQTVQTQSLIAAVYDGANSISTGTVRFTNANGVSFSINGQTVSASVAAQSNQTVGGYAVGNTTGQSSSSTFDARTLSFNGAGNVSVGYSNSSIIISGGTAAPSPVNFSAGTTSGNLGSVVFSNSNGLSFGLNGSTITGSVSTYSTVGTATTVTPVASANSVGTVTRWAAEDHRHAGIGGLGISTAGNTTGTTGSQVGTYWLQGSNDITLSQITSNNGSHTLVIVGQPPLSYWKNAAAENLNQTQTQSVSGSTSYIQPLVLYNDVSASYVRFLHSFGVTNTTSIATTANATGSCSVMSTLFMVVYTKGTGASSNSLQAYLSSSVGLTQMWSLSANANGSQWTLSQSITHPVTGNTSQFTTGVTTSLSNYSLGSLSLTRFTGLQHLDIPFATLLSAGNYWVMVGASSATSTGGSGAAFTQLRMSNSMVVMSQINSAIPLMGQVTANSVQYELGHGSFSTNAIGTTASLDFSNITSSASHPLMPFQFMRIT